MPVLGYRAAVENMIRLHELDGAKLGSDRAVGLPSLDVSVAEMIASLNRVAASRKLGEIRIERDPFIERIVAGWPVASDSARARALGLIAEDGLDPIVRAYVEDFLDA